MALRSRCDDRWVQRGARCRRETRLTYADVIRPPPAARIQGAQLSIRRPCAMHAPTQRELLLVSLLFIALLTFSSTRLSNQGLTRIDLSSVWNDTPRPPKPSGIPTLPSDTRLSWGTSKVPRTRIIAHVPGECVLDVYLFILTLLQGWTIFDRMYIYNGTVFLVSDDPETFPDRKFMTSSGAIIEDGKKDVRLPSDKNMRIISTSTAQKLFGTGANRIQGVTVCAFTTLPETSPHATFSGSSTIPGNSQYPPPLIHIY